ncbi:hypothetical protein CJU90_3862 [Yarrowia sp. C11]|nr:hypothetical protein CKK34_5473 [Yarrowia sp. E02]KAG5367563.1 hypothetical protein CJU90_3862 [Yarrowia sp. C11]
MVWNLGQLFGTPATNIIKFLVFVYSLGEGEMPQAETKAEQVEIVRKAFVQALLVLFENPPGFPETLPGYCTYEMAGRIIMSHAGKSGLFPFDDLNWKSELRAMDKAGDNVLDGMEIDILKGVVGLEPHDLEMALEIIVERYPHRNKDTWRSLAETWQETALVRYKGVSKSGEDVETYLRHFRKRFPSTYARRRLRTSVHDRVLAAAYRARYYCRSKDGKVARMMQDKFPHRSATQWQGLMNSTFDTWLQLYDFSKIYDDRSWMAYYRSQKESIDATRRKSGRVEKGSERRSNPGREKREKGKEKEV